MPDYAKLNLGTEVENSAPKFGMPDGMSAHFSGGALEMTAGGMAYERLEAGSGRRSGTPTPSRRRSTS